MSPGASSSISVPTSALSEDPSNNHQDPALVGAGVICGEEDPVAEDTNIDLADSAESLLEEPQPFADLGLRPEVNSAIDKAGYSIPTPIQIETIPSVLQNRDLMGQAETGSGKTAAFAWPLLSRIDMAIKSPQVLVLTPTRELAIQVTKSFEKYGACLDGFRAVSIYGGQSYETQLRALRRGVQVVVGTPGRVMDHLRRETLDLSNLTTFVLDEADEMLRMGFIDDVEWTMEQLPEQRQILLFSATLPGPVRRIAEKYLNNPVNIAIKQDNAAAESIDQSCIQAHSREKLQTLAQILDSEATEGVLVFVKTRNSTVTVADQLTKRGFSAAPMNGEIPQNQRERTVEQLKSGRLNVVVATDVAARGLDVQRISHVINYDFPHDTEAYVHRIGRTGRAGRTGSAILFYEPKEKGKLARLQRATNQRIGKFAQKTIKEVNAVRVADFKQRITACVDHEQLDFFTKLVAEHQSDTGASLGQIAASLAIMAQGDVPLLLKEISRPNSNWKKDRNDGDKATYRIEVGRNHGVGPGNIVGAITNEADLNNSQIGKIRLLDNFSTIDLPANLSDDVIAMLQDVVVSGKRLQISRDKANHSEGRRQKSKKNNGSTKFVSKKRDVASRPASPKPSVRKTEASTPFAEPVTRKKQPLLKGAISDGKARRKKPNKPTKKYVKIRSAH
jgi:ATP-dependent RNA helicase DeaD